MTRHLGMLPRVESGEGRKELQVPILMPMKSLSIDFFFLTNMCQYWLSLSTDRLLKIQIAATNSLSIIKDLKYYITDYKLFVLVNVDYYNIFRETENFKKLWEAMKFRYITYKKAQKFK